MLAKEADGTAAASSSDAVAPGTGRGARAQVRTLQQAGATAGANLYSLLSLKPYYSEFKALVDLIGLSAAARYPFAPSVPNPFHANASGAAPRTAFIPNNNAMAQAYSALLARASRPAICTNAAVPAAVSCGWKLPKTAADWPTARPDLRVALLANLQYMQLVVASHVLREGRSLGLSALAPGLDTTSSGIVFKPTDADRVTAGQERSLLYFYAARSAAHMCHHMWTMHGGSGKAMQAMQALSRGPADQRTKQRTLHTAMCHGYGLLCVCACVFVCLKIAQRCRAHACTYICLHPYACTHLQRSKPAGSTRLLGQPVQRESLAGARCQLLRGAA